MKAIQSCAVFFLSMMGAIATPVSPKPGSLFERQSCLATCPDEVRSYICHPDVYPLTSNTDSGLVLVWHVRNLPGWSNGCPMCRLTLLVAFHSESELLILESEVLLPIFWSQAFESSESAECFWIGGS